MRSLRGARHQQNRVCIARVTHCPAFEHHRATLRIVVASLPGAEASIPVLTDGEGLIASYEMTFWEVHRRPLVWQPPR